MTGGIPPRQGGLPPVSVSPPNDVSDKPGQCPACGGVVLRADVPVTDPEDSARSPRSLLIEVSVVEGAALLPLSGMACVVRSAVGRVRVVQPALHRVHICPPGVFLAQGGAYSPEILAVPCPVDFCLVHPGEMCVNGRGETSTRPHGLRRQFSDEQLGRPIPVRLEIDDGPGPLPG